MNDAFKNIKRTPKATKQPDRSHFPATAPRANTGIKMKKPLPSTPDFKLAKSLNVNNTPADRGFVTNNPFYPFQAYGGKTYGQKIRSGK